MLSSRLADYVFLGIRYVVYGDKKEKLNWRNFIFYYFKGTEQLKQIHVTYSAYDYASYRDPDFWSFQ